MRSSAFAPFVVSLIAATVGFALFRGFLSGRSDYVGHFMAGFGATLGVIAFAMHVIGRDVAPVDLGRPVFVLVIVCIGLGAICEATLFRIAQFDPVDFFNQSLGAVVAGLASLAARPERAPPGAVFVGFGIVAVASLYEGFVRAFA